jgi:integrase
VIEFLAAVARGETPWAKPEIQDKLTLEAFLRDIYGPWFMEHRRSWKKTLPLFGSSFAGLMKKPIDGISVADIERRQTKKRREEGVKASTVNRQVASLKSAINWAVKRGVIGANNMAKLERLREQDSDTKLRYLSPDERERLFAALDAREERIRKERDTHNEWLQERGRVTLPSLRGQPFTDYLKPMIVLSLNTGIRQGALFALEWGDIDFDNRVLTLRAESSKSGKANYVPLNGVALQALLSWRTEVQNEKLVFPSAKTGGKLDNCRKAWAKLLKDAGIENFRWHDMRHDFASQLVMKGVDLNTVRELMGHADLKMTLRYAHLAPKVKRAAVEMLG